VEQQEERQAATAPISEKKAGRLLVISKHLLYPLIIFILFFGGLELILALSGVKPILLTEDPLVGFASNSPLFVEGRRDDGTPVMRTAKNRLSFFNYQEFQKVKDPDSYRIFCVGGSTTFGRPFKHKTSFCGWLDAFLKTAEPNRNWEVINAGGVSYASYRVANLMKELVQYQSDLFIVYTGQNEYLEERSYGRLAELPAGVIRAVTLLNSTRTYSTMKRLIDALRPGSLQQARKRYEVSGEVDDILTHTLGPTSYHRDDDLRQQILTHYRLNLERIVGLAQDAGAEVIFVNPVVNLKDMSPFKSEHKEGLAEAEEKAWSSLFAQAKIDHAAGRYSEALAQYQKALRIDDRYAELHFQMGRVLFDLARYDEAEKSFWRAVDEDVAPLRMLS
jgi:tetratricopeptide (TPR) repeat protein